MQEKFFKFTHALKRGLVLALVNGQPKKIWTHNPNACAKCTLDKLKETNRQILDHWYGAKKP